MASPELFIETMKSMAAGDTLMIMGGTFPGPNEHAQIIIGLGHIIPVLHIVTGREQYAPRPNPLVVDPSEMIDVLAERNDRRFGQDYGERGPEITYGKAAGTILGLTVDFWILNPLAPNSFYFVGKSDQ
jgi:hypothetical protein